jgi:hypothetical protein
MAQSPLLNRLMADVVLLAHFAFVLFAVFGAFLVLVDSSWAWVHIPAVVWSSVVNLASGTCPLTPLENRYRSRMGASYEGGFIQHYVRSVVYPGGMPRRLELIAGISIVVWNGIVYAVLVSWVRSAQAN